MLVVEEEVVVSEEMCVVVVEVVVWRSGWWDGVGISVAMNCQRVEANTGLQETGGQE